MLASFGYTSGKLTLITDEVTKAATRITYSGSAVTKLEQGYNEGGFVARTYMNVSSSGARTLLKSEKNVYTSYYIDCKGNVFAGAAIGSLAADTITLGLNLITGKENRTPLEIINDTATNMTISLVLSAAGPAVIGLRNAGKSVLKPLLKEATEITLQELLYNMGEESVNSGIQSVFTFLLEKFSNLIRGRK